MHSNDNLLSPQSKNFILGHTPSIYGYINYADICFLLWQEALGLNVVLVSGINISKNKINVRKIRTLPIVEKLEWAVHMLHN